MTITHPSAPRVLAEAVPFCFGPVSTGLAITSELAALGCEVVWLATGTSLELLEASGWEGETVASSTHDPEGWNCVRSICRDVDIVLVNTDPDFAVWAMQCGARQLAYVDILYWMWDAVPKQILDSALPYIIETFDGIDEQYSRLGKPHCSVEVAPLLNRGTAVSALCPNRDLLLVSLGGVGNSFSDCDDLCYPKEMLAWLLPSIVNSGFREVVICGGQLPPRDQIGKLPSSWLYGLLSPKEHAKVLASASAALLSPGLTVFFEWLSTNTPAMFLPPQNYSQVLQLNTYAMLGVKGATASFDNLGVECPVGKYEPESVSVPKVRSALSKLFRSTESRALFQDLVADFLSEAHNSPNDFQPPSRLLSKWGRDGARQAASAILDVFAKTRNVACE